MASVKYAKLVPDVGNKLLMVNIAGTAVTGAFDITEITSRTGGGLAPLPAFLNDVMTKLNDLADDQWSKKVEGIGAVKVYVPAVSGVAAENKSKAPPPAPHPAPISPPLLVGWLATGVNEVGQTYTIILVFDVPPC